MDKPKFVSVIGSKGSLSMTIPKEMAQSMGLEKGDYIRMQLDGKRIIITKPDD